MAVVIRNGDLVVDMGLTYNAGQLGKILQDIAEGIASGVVPDDSLTTAKYQALSVTGAKIADNTIATAKYQDDSVTYAKLQNVSATKRLLGRTTAAAGNVEELAFSAYWESLWTVADEAALKAAVNLEPGVDVQAFNAILADIAGVTQAANKGIYFDSSTTAATFDLSAQGRALCGSGESKDLKLSVNRQTGTTYTLLSSDHGKVVECANASGITVTLPNNLAVDFVCRIVQGGAGQITLSKASGAELRNRQTHTKTAGQWAGVDLWIRTNSGGSAAEYVLTGDTAA